MALSIDLHQRRSTANVKNTSIVTKGACHETRDFCELARDISYRRVNTERGGRRIHVDHSLHLHGGAAGLVLDASGALYGTTTEGGNLVCALNTAGTGCGTVFKLTPPSTTGTAWTKTVLHSFSGSDGAFVTADLVFGTGAAGVAERHGARVAIAPDGALYGTTNFGGNTSCPPFGCGTVFKLTPPSTAGGAWTETVLYRFAGGNDGAFPGVAFFGTDGALYGTTGAGGNTGCPPNPGEGCGTVFRAVSERIESVGGFPNRLISASSFTLREWGRRGWVFPTIFVASRHVAIASAGPLGRCRAIQSKARARSTTSEIAVAAANASRRPDSRSVSRKCGAISAKA